jgi:hypothetical protein
MTTTRQPILKYALVILVFIALVVIPLCDNFYIFFKLTNAPKSEVEKLFEIGTPQAQDNKTKPRGGIYDPSLPKFLWGIPTVDNEKERSRRQAIRDTYLSYYKNKKDANRICSLKDIQTKRISLQDCQLAYAFFMGGNPKGPTELLQPNSTFPMTVDDSLIKNAEDDVVYLNIRENQFDGKMHTWFKFSSLIVDDFYFDYITKVDSDTLLFAPAFLEDFAATLPTHPIRVYGGLPYDKNYCDPNEKDDHPCPLPLVGDMYMSGELSFMSPDLADFITSSKCDRKAITISHEDVSLSNYVFSHPLPVHVVKVEQDQILRNVIKKLFLKRGQTAAFHRKKEMFRGTLWAHSIAMSGGYFKDLKNFRVSWKEFEYWWTSNDPGKRSSIMGLLGF